MSEELEEILEARVQRGIARLDSVLPGWREEIDKDRLDLASVTHCPLGQLYGNYANGYYALGSDFEPCEYGFEDDRSLGITYEDLTGAWHWALTHPLVSL